MTQGVLINKLNNLTDILLGGASKDEVLLAFCLDGAVLVCREAGCSVDVELRCLDQILGRSYEVQHGPNPEHVKLIDATPIVGVQSTREVGVFLFNNIYDWLKRLHTPVVWETA